MVSKNITKILISLFIINGFILWFTIASDFFLIDFFDEKNINSILTKELQKTELLHNGELEEFEYTNIWYIKRHILHCKIIDVNKNFDIENQLKNNNWEKKDGNFKKNNLIMVVNKNDDNVVVNIYYN